jgi:hypothetical protein
LEEIAAKKAHVLILGSIFFLLIFGSANANAYKSEKLPISPSSNDWKVKIDNSDVEILKENEREFNVYSINVRNLGSQVYDVVRHYPDVIHVDSRKNS